MTKVSIEVWRQDTDNQDLWHGDNHLIVNTAALQEREAYYEIVRIPMPNFNFDSDSYLAHSSSH